MSYSHHRLIIFPSSISRIPIIDQSYSHHRLLIFPSSVTHIPIIDQSYPVIDSSYSHHRLIIFPSSSTHILIMPDLLRLEPWEHASGPTATALAVSGLGHVIKRGDRRWRASGKQAHRRANEYTWGALYVVHIEKQCPVSRLPRKMIRTFPKCRHRKELKPAISWRKSKTSDVEQRHAKPFSKELYWTVSKKSPYYGSRVTRQSNRVLVSDPLIRQLFFWVGARHFSCVSRLWGTIIVIVSCSSLCQRNTEFFLKPFNKAFWKMVLHFFAQHRRFSIFCKR